MLSNEELLKTFQSGRNTAHFAITYMGFDPEEARRSLRSVGYDLTNGLYATPFVLGYHMVMIEETPDA